MIACSPNAASQLVELCEAKVLCAFHEHGHCLWDIHADLNNRGGDEYLDGALPETLEYFMFFLRRHAAMEFTHPKIWEDFTFERFVLGIHRFGILPSCLLFFFESWRSE